MGEPDRLMGWTPIRDTTALTPTPEAPPPGYLRISDKRGVHLVRKETPTLPSMPDLLPDDPTEAAYSMGALRAMMTAHTSDNEQVRAIAGAIRAVTVGAGLFIAATMAWAAGYLLWPAVTLEMLPVAWLVALVATVGYSLASEGAGRRYSAAGVERLKIETAERMHRDRLESREAMHAAATEAWENVLTHYLDKEF